MDELLFGQVDKLSETHFVSFGRVKIVFVDEHEVLDEDLESEFLLDFIISTVELDLKIFKL